MISIVHPIDFEYEILFSLIDDLPSLYEEWAKKIEAQAKTDAEDAANGDEIVYQTIYHIYDDVIESVYEVPCQSRGYLLAAIYAFYERNMRCVFKEIGILDHDKKSLTARCVFDTCGILINENQGLYDGIELLGLIRNNLSHGKLNNRNYWKRLNDYVANNEFLEMNDDIVFIKEGTYLLQSLNLVYSLFQAIFESNSIFQTKFIGGDSQKS